MKNHILFLLGLVFTQTVAAQSTYHSLVEEGKVWHYKVSNYYPTYDLLEWNETYSLEGDTAIGHHMCKKLFLSTSGPYDSTDHKYTGAMYERSKKVYYIAPDSTKATLLYDFSCKPEDTICVRTYVYNTWFNLIVKKKMCINYLGEDLTVIDWSPMGQSGYSDENEVYENCTGTAWIEGIGSPLDLLNNNPTWGATAGVPAGRLLTCTLDGEVIFDLDNFNSNSLPVPMEGTSQRYFTLGTKWTEIRLDTLKYDSWYSKVDGELAPNFETVEYSVMHYPNHNDVWCSNDNYSLRYKINVTNGTESQTFVLLEQHTDEDISIIVYDHSSYARAYQFYWSVGKELSYQNIVPSHSSSYQYYGIIDEIKEGDFGGVRPLKYVDLDGTRIIQGIGVTQWNDGECIFGPVNRYRYSSSQETPPERHYRSMLVHFERDGEVLYDVWPEKPVASEPVAFTAGQIATIILPTEPDASKGKYYRLDRYEDGQIIFEEETHPQARTPYVIVPNEDFNIDLSTLDVDGLRFDTLKTEAASPLNPSRTYEIRFVGTYAKREIGEKDNGFRFYILDTTPDCIYHPEGKSSITMGPLRAHFEVNIAFCYDRETMEYWDELKYVLHDYGTGIASPLRETEEGAIFDLQGRKLQGKPAQGIYIENGQKKVKR